MILEECRNHDGNKGFHCRQLPLVYGVCRSTYFTLPIPYHSSSSVHGERVIFSGTEGSTASLSLAALCLLFGTFGDDGLLDSGESYSATKMKDVDLVRPNQ
jgi:hypothetical protein